MRALIDIPKDVIKHLDALARSRQLSRAEIVRRAIAMYLAAQQHPHEREEVFGLWKDRTGDSLDDEDRLRSEWSRE
jgi:metal-responsive CopG/Arc/MetJ family transcriptional regulator